MNGYWALWEDLVSQLRRLKHHLRAWSASSSPSVPGGPLAKMKGLNSRVGHLNNFVGSYVAL